MRDTNHICKIDVRKSQRAEGLLRSIRGTFTKSNVSSDGIRVLNTRDLKRLEVVVPEPAQALVAAHLNIVDVANGFDVGGKVVRKTLDRPPKVSVYDLIEVVTGQEPNAARKAFYNLEGMHPEVAENIRDFKFPGRGQRPTPVTDARGVVTLINLLPGRRAAEFRAASADVMVRFMGGDVTLIAEIQRNAEAQQALPTDNPARLFGEDVEARVRYTRNASTLAIASGPLMGFDEPGVYLIEYGAKMLYNMEGVPENAKVVGFGHAKVSGAARCAEHKRLTGLTTRVLDFVPTPFYERCEKQLENRLKAVRKIVKGNIVGTQSEMREQFYVTSNEDYDAVRRSVQADADACKTQVQASDMPLLIEQEKTKQIVAQAQAQVSVVEASVQKAQVELHTKEVELQIVLAQIRLCEQQQQQRAA